MSTDPIGVESLRVQAWAASHSGNREYAEQLFRQILKDHPDSQAAGDAKLYFADDPKRINAPPELPIQRVTVVDLDIGFMNMVGLFIKAAFAVIPAAIIVAVVYSIVMAMLAGVFRGY